MKTHDQLEEIRCSHTYVRHPEYEKQGIKEEFVSDMHMSFYSKDLPGNRRMFWVEDWDGVVYVRYTYNVISDSHKKPHCIRIANLDNLGLWDAMPIFIEGGLRAGTYLAFDHCTVCEEEEGEQWLLNRRGFYRSSSYVYQEGKVPGFWGPKGRELPQFWARCCINDDFNKYYDSDEVFGILEELAVPLNDSDRETIKGWFSKSIPDIFYEAYLRLRNPEKTPDYILRNLLYGIPLEFAASDIKGETCYE